MIVNVVGLDPAFSNIGLCLGRVDISDPKNPYVTEMLDLGLIHTAGIKSKKIRKNSDDLRRARLGVHGIRTYVKNWERDYGPIWGVFAEIPLGSQSARASWALGIAIGVIASIDLPLVELTPREVKAATGNKFNDKPEIMDWARKNYPSLPWAMRKLHGVMVPITGQNEHTADAVAAVHAGVAHKSFRDMLSSRT